MSGAFALEVPRAKHFRENTKQNKRKTFYDSNIKCKLLCGYFSEASNTSKVSLIVDELSVPDDKLD